MLTTNRVHVYPVAAVVRLLFFVAISTIVVAQEGHTAEFDKACQSKSGTWLEKYSECEYADRQWCAAAGGRFDECASACRHNPDPATLCTMQCVPVCAFSDEKVKPNGGSPSTLDQALDTLQGGAAAGANIKSGSPQGSSTVAQPPPAAPPVENKAEPENTKKSKKKLLRGSIVAAPLPVVSPAIGSGLIPVLGYIFPFSKNDHVSPPSTVGGGGLITNNGTRAWGLGGQLFMKENTYEVTAGFGRGNLNYDLYGVGFLAGEEGLKLPLQQSGQVFFAEVLRRIVWKIFVGPRFSNGSSLITVLPNNGNTPPPPPDVGLQTELRALGFRVVRDTRPNHFYPTAGTFMQFTSDFFSQALGSKYSFQSYKFTFDKYWSLNKSQVLAYDLYVCNVGGSPPFYGNCIYGTNNELRGYTAGRYLDRHMFATQAEYRLSLPKRIGLAGFAGVGEVFPGPTEILRSNRLLPDIGGGPRYQLSTKYHLNLRADFARGRDSWTWSMGVGEAF